MTASSHFDGHFDFSKAPLEHFEQLLSEAQKQIAKDFNAMSLATCSVGGVPSVRTVLFKGLVRGGLSFYTNYDSQKAHELLETKRAAALFFWAPLERQIRIDGVIEKMTREESEAYFKTRARLSQIGAWASEQSHRLSSFEELQEKVQELEKRFQGRDVPCPPNWGGFLLRPLKIEFWFGRSGRLHERYVYERADVGSSWQTYMKSP
jgi:pyridoxamine 5'-phosphate oxidase